MKKLSTIMLFCILTIGFAATASAVQWQEIHYKDADILWLFDSHSYETINSATYSVEIKAQYTDSFGKQVSEEIGLAKPVAYFTKTYLFNYKEKTYNSLNVTFYDKNNNVLRTTNYPADATMYPFESKLDEVMFEQTFFHYNKYYR